MLAGSFDRLDGTISNDANRRRLAFGGGSVLQKEMNMSGKRAFATTVASMFLSLSLAGYACAQDNGGAPPPGGQPQGMNNNGGGRRRFDPQQMMQRRLDQVKEDLGASDEEWSALQPKVQKVMDLQFQEMRSRMGGMRRGGGGGPPGGSPDDQANQNPVEKAMSDLRAAVNANASADDLAKKLQAVRDARAQVQTDMTKAQADLKQLLTQRQEAQMVLAGVLE
jgi:hypothetical protein